MGEHNTKKDLFLHVKFTMPVLSEEEKQQQKLNKNKELQSVIDELKAANEKSQDMKVKEEMNNAVAVLAKVKAKII